MERKIKVLHVITRFLNGGTEKNVINSINALPKDKYEVEVAVGQNSNLSLIPSDIKAEKIDSLVRSANPWKNIKALKDLFKHLKANNYDIIHTHQANAGVVGRLSAKSAKVPIIIHGLHGPTFHSNQNIFEMWFYILTEKILAKITTVFTVVGHDLKNRYLKKGIGREKNYHVIRSGMELKRFSDVSEIRIAERNKIRKELGFDEGKFLIGVIAALEPRKGHIYLIEAARTLKNKNVKFLFVGGGWYEEKLRKKVLDFGLEDTIKFIGYREDVENIIAASDVIALTSLWEGLPQVLVQAAAAGKPMVSFAVEGATEVIKEGVNGFSVPLKDVKAFERKLRYLIKNPKKAEEMGKKGKEIIGDEWKLSRMQEKVIKLYEGLIKINKI